MIVSTAEDPVYTSSQQQELYVANLPQDVPDQDSWESSFLETFTQDVYLMLHVSGDSQFQAAVTSMAPPSGDFSRPVFYPMAGMVAGKFAGIETVLVHTLPGELVGDAVKSGLSYYDEVTLIIGVGVAYSFDRDTHSLGDVLVSERIGDLQNFLFEVTGERERSGQISNAKLTTVLCTNLNIVPEFQVSASGRTANVHSGLIVSYPVIVNSQEVREKLHDVNPTAIGAEMDGHALLPYILDSTVTGVILVEGVVERIGGDAWDFTATKAALTYTESKLVSTDASYIERL